MVLSDSSALSGFTVSVTFNGLQLTLEPEEMVKKGSH